LYDVIYSLSILLKNIFKFLVSLTNQTKVYSHYS